MPTLPQAVTPSIPVTAANQRLLGTALAGLLCLATAGCSSKQETPASVPETVGGAVADPPHITSSKAAGVLTVDDFTALCDERGGAVEVMPHCGGFATAKGFSYDTSTQTLSEHTCMGTNTCGGWNCVTDI